MDVKIQAFAATTDPSKADFRKSAGAFVGAPEDNHRTILEFRVSDMDLQELGMDIDDAIKHCEAINKMINAGVFKQFSDSLLGTVGEVGVKLGIAATGLAIRIYDND